jgi:hypothetical protein
MNITPYHRSDSSGDEDIACIDNGVGELCPESFVIRAFITDNIDFLRTACEPADACEKNESAHYAKGHISFAAVGFPVPCELDTYHAERNEHDQAEKDIIPDEESVSEPRDIEEVTGHLQTTVGAAEEEHRDKHDA